MKTLSRFEYFKPRSFEEAIKLLNEHKGKIRPLAGGTDLIVSMKEKGLKVQNILDLKGIEGYDFIREANGSIEIGALTTIRSIETSQIIRQRCPFLSEAAGVLGSVQVRNMATIGGNVCNASPSAEMAPPLMALEAQLEIIGDKGTRRVPLEGFFTGPGQSVLMENELVTMLVIPLLPPNSAGAYIKHSPRKAMDIAVVSVCCAITFDFDKRRCIDSRVVLGAVAPTPLRARRVESVLNNKEITEMEIEEAMGVAACEARPITDIRASAQYRTEMIKVFVGRGIREASRRIRSH